LQTISKLLVGATLMAGLAAVPALSQGISIGPGGVRVDDGRRYDRGPPREDLSRGEAIRIARREGLLDVDDVDRRGSRLIVRGQDRRGDDLTVVVDGITGDVLDVRRR
jgi:hypothetical protein